MQLSQYIIFKQKKNARLLKTNVFKLIASKNFLNNIQLFKFCFVDEIKNLSINNIYTKN